MLNRVLGLSPAGIETPDTPASRQMGRHTDGGMPAHAVCRASLLMATPTACGQGGLGPQSDLSLPSIAQTASRFDRF